MCFVEASDARRGHKSASMAKELNVAFGVFNYIVNVWTPRHVEVEYNPNGLTQGDAQRFAAEIQSWMWARRWSAQVRTML